MDDYYLSREDWDTVVERGLGDFRDEAVLKKIPTATKTAFTRKYNSREHPIPFHRAQDLGKVPKALAAAGPLPDLEEALDVSALHACRYSSAHVRLRWTKKSQT